MIRDPGKGESPRSCVREGGGDRDHQIQRACIGIGLKRGRMEEISQQQIEIPFTRKGKKDLIQDLGLIASKSFLPHETVKPGAPCLSGKNRQGVGQIKDMFKGAVEIRKTPRELKRRNIRLVKRVKRSRAEAPGDSTL